MKSLKALITLILCLISCICFLLGIGDVFNHFNIPNWLRYILLIPAISLLIIIFRGVMNECAELFNLNNEE